MKTNSPQDGCQRSLCTQIAAIAELAAMAEPTAGSQQHAARSQIGAALRSSVLVPRTFRIGWSCFLRRLFLLFLCPVAAPLPSVTFTAPPTWSRPPCISDPVTPPSYISCSTPAATIIPDMVPAWSLTPSVTVAVVSSQRARFNAGPVLYSRKSFLMPCDSLFPVLCPPAFLFLTHASSKRLFSTGSCSLF